MQFSTHSRGIKRKRSSLSNENEATKITGKLIHGMKEVTKAAKKAKAFETRKIVKRLKAPGASLGKKNTEKLALETELDALKATDHNRIGVLALKSKLKKDKFLWNEPSIQTAISKLFPPDVTFTAEAVANKLESRLLSSRTLSGAVNAVISSLCSTLKPVEAHRNNPVEGSSRSQNLQNDNRLVASKSRADVEESEDNPEHSTADRLTSPEADTSDESEPEGDTSSDDDSAADGGPGCSRASTTPSSRDSPSDRASPMSHVGGVSKASGVNSVFLPTLSNGFIPGGSDTDWSDGETEAHGGGVRKNRRGQRARRAIWEKKYGRRAKHLQNQEDPGATHLQPSMRKHVQKSQVVTHSRPTSSTRQYGRANKGEGVSNGQMPHKQKVGHVDDLALHPSWVAKRRMKEKSSPAILPSQGKRIKFDD